MGGDIQDRVKAQERRLHGNMRPRPRGENLGGVNAKRGSTSSHRVTPACMERTLRVRTSLKPVWWTTVLADIRYQYGNGMKGRSRRETCPLPERETL